MPQAYHSVNVRSLPLQLRILLTAEIQKAGSNPPATNPFLKFSPFLKGAVCTLQNLSHLVYAAVVVYSAHRCLEILF
jgi:hypothetical protein